jgi:hypothetical protein
MILLLPIGCSDNSALIWKSKEQAQGKNEFKKITVRLIKETRLRLFEDCIGLEMWSAVYDASCINTKVNAFLSITNAMTDNCFPTKIVKVLKDDKPMTGRIKQMISKRNKMHQRGRKEEYRSLRNKIILEIRKEKQVKYYNEKINSARCSSSRCSLF